MSVGSALLVFRSTTLKLCVFVLEYIACVRSTTLLL